MLDSGWLHSPWFSWYCTRYFVTSVESANCCCHWMFTERLLIITDSKFAGLFGGSRQQYITQCHQHYFISLTYLVKTIMLELIKTWVFRSSGTWHCVVRSVSHDCRGLFVLHLQGSSSARDLLVCLNLKMKGGKPLTQWHSIILHNTQLQKRYENLHSCMTGSSPRTSAVFAVK